MKSKLLNTLYFMLFAFAMNAQQLAFPGAEGYGKYTVGGRGGAVYEVTNLNDAGTGSLRAAVAASGARTVVFRVSGTITLNSELKISNPNITIAGQTAPGDGICIRKYPLVIGANQIIIRHIRVRLGDESGLEADAVSGRAYNNLILDHVSASWSVDETMSIYFCSNMTIQNCLVAESMYNSNHPKGAHGFGGIWGSDYGSYHHNLIAHHSSRNPRFASGCGYTDYRNNVVYNWGYNSSYGGEMVQVGDPAHVSTNINMVANYYKPGPATKPGDVTKRIVNPSSRNLAADYGKWYVAENVMVGNTAVTNDNWNAGGTVTTVGGVQPQDGASYKTGIKLDAPWPAMAINQQTATEAYYTVLDNAGATLPKRDIVDARIVSDTRNGTATYEGVTYKQNQTVPNAANKCGIIDSQADVGGWPTLNSLTAPTDTDHDGMPDYWEIARGLNPNNSTDRNTVNADGYTNLERYLNGDTVIPVGTVNTCINSLAFNATNSGSWVNAKDPTSAVLICTDTMNLIASIMDNGNYGAFSSSYYVSNTTRLLPNNKPLLNRNITIAPASPASITSPVTVRLYFKVAEYNALKAADPTIASLADLRVLRTDDNSCIPTLSGSNNVIVPTATGTVGTYSDGYYVEFATSSFGTFFIASASSVVPLELLSINATLVNKQAKISWVTTNEYNTKNFIVEKSTDGKTFLPIGSVDAKGKSAAINTYSFLDVNEINDVTYYRLNQFDNDGAHRYSPIMSVDVKGKSLLSVYPNPTTETVVVNHYKATEGSLLKVFNVEGKVVKQFPLSIDVEQTILDLKDLNNGVYMLVFKNETTIMSVKLIKN